MYHNSRSRQLMNIDKVSACRTFLSRLRRHAEGTTGILWSIGYMYPNVEHVQLLDTCRKRSIFDFGYRRHVERSVHTGATCRILHVECLHVATVWTSYKTSDRQTWRRIRTRQDKAKRRRKIHQYRGISCYGMLCFTIARSTSPARRDGVCRSELYWVRTVDHTHGTAPAEPHQHHRHHHHQQQQQQQLTPVSVVASGDFAQFYGQFSTKSAATRPALYKQHWRWSSSCTMSNTISECSAISSVVAYTSWLLPNVADQR